MTCSDLNNQLDDYVDGTLDDATSSMFDSHIAGCGECRERVAKEQRLRDALAQYAEHSVPKPDPEFFDRALVRAVHNGSRKQRSRWMLTGFGGAIAAGLVVWLIGGMLLRSPSLPSLPDPTIPEVTMALEEPRTINLVFSSADELTDATLTVSLPAGLELAGFQGQSEVTWMTSLSKGKNLLPLKLIATTPHGGELLATLRHEDDDRTFRLQVTII